MKLKSIYILVLLCTSLCFSLSAQSNESPKSFLLKAKSNGQFLTLKQDGSNTFQTQALLSGFNQQAQVFFARLASAYAEGTGKSGEIRIISAAENKETLTRNSNGTVAAQSLPTKAENDLSQIDLAATQWRINLIDVQKEGNELKYYYSISDSENPRNALKVNADGSVSWEKIDVSTGALVIPNTQSQPQLDGFRFSIESVPASF